VSQDLYYSRQYRVTGLVVIVITSQLFVNQQCSDVRLHSLAYKYESDFESNGHPYRLSPPSDYEQYPRYVIMVDMSRSMLAGPCPFDVGVSPTFHTDSYYRPYDPNKDTGADINDGRGAARGCYVDPSLPVQAGAQTIPQPYEFGKQYGTFIGSDFEAYRFQILEKWIAQ
jgi:hypothetical protein